jgi:hypothetical protein
MSLITPSRAGTPPRPGAVCGLLKSSLFISPVTGKQLIVIPPEVDGLFKPILDLELDKQLMPKSHGLPGVANAGGRLMEDRERRVKVGLLQKVAMSSRFVSTVIA